MTFYCIFWKVYTEESKKWMKPVKSTCLFRYLHIHHIRDATHIADNRVLLHLACVSIDTYILISIHIYCTLHEKWWYMYMYISIVCIISLQLKYMYTFMTSERSFHSKQKGFDILLYLCSKFPYSYTRNWKFKYAIYASRELVAVIFYKGCYVIL